MLQEIYHFFLRLHRGLRSLWGRLLELSAFKYWRMTPATPVNPFAVILEQVMLLGGFAKVVGVLAFTASLAAIMSTADSLIIAISQLVTARRMLSIHSNQQQLVFKLRTWIGRSVSLFSTIVAAIIALIWDEGINIGTDTVWYFVPSMSSVHRGTVVCSFS